MGDKGQDGNTLRTLLLEQGVTPLHPLQAAPQQEGPFQQEALQGGLSSQGLNKMRGRRTIGLLPEESCEPGEHQPTFP